MVLDRLNVALQDPAVRLLVVESLGNYRIMAGTPKFPMDYLTSDPTISRTLRTEYQSIPANALPGFSVFIHKTASHARS